MQTRFLEERIDYDGAQLRSHWVLRRTGIVGDALVAFRGACDVRTGEVCDLEDLLAGSSIAGSDMLHFLWETFDDGDLLRAVYRQRLMAAQAADLLRETSPEPAVTELRRDGDDLWGGDRKLSISVASRSMVSTLIHFAVNVDNRGTPVPTLSLSDLAVDPEVFAPALLERVASEDASIRAARAQVRGREESEA